MKIRISMLAMSISALFLMAPFAQAQDTVFSVKVVPTGDSNNANKRTQATVKSNSSARTSERKKTNSGTNNGGSPCKGASCASGEHFPEPRK